MRRMIYDDFKSVLCDKSFPGSTDVLLTPVTLGSAPCQSTMRNMGPVESSVYDTYTAPVNLSGIVTVLLLSVVQCAGHLHTLSHNVQF